MPWVHLLVAQKGSINFRVPCINKGTTINTENLKLTSREHTFRKYQMNFSEGNRVVGGGICPWRDRSTPLKIMAWACTLGLRASPIFSSTRQVKGLHWQNDKNATRRFRTADVRCYYGWKNHRFYGKAIFSASQRGGPPKSMTRRNQLECWMRFVVGTRVLEPYASCAC